MKRLVLSLLIGQSLAVSAFAQNRTAPNDVFHQDTDIRDGQILLTGADALFAYLVFPPTQNSIVKSADKRLDAAKIEVDEAKAKVEVYEFLPTSKEDKAVYLRAIIENPNHYESAEDVGKLAKLKSTAKFLYQGVSDLPIVSVEKRIQMQLQSEVQVHKALIALNEARIGKILASSSAGFLKGGIKVTGYVLSGVFVLDGLGRVILWEAMDENPKIFPEYTAYEKYVAKRK